MAAYEILLLNTTIPQIQAAQSGDTYVVPRDIAFSAALTLSAGTANGVPYLNASKVLTTGSALTFDGTTLTTTGRIAVSGTNPSIRQTVQNAYLDLCGGTTVGVDPSIQLAGSTTAGDAATVFYNTNTHVFRSSSGVSEYMRLTSTGLGIGTNNPVAKLSFGNTIPSDGQTVHIYQSGTVRSGLGVVSGVYRVFTDSSSVLSFGQVSNSDGSTYTERARITSGGEFLVGTTTTGVGNADGVGIGYNSGASYQSIGHANGTSSGAVYISFGYNAGAIGNITQNGTTGVLYNITSDYRLKDVVGAVTGAGARIDALKPVDYTWKTDGAAARGFLAHEFQEIYPNSVIGTKDAVDEEGKPIHQQMQASTSEVIADLVAELQSLRARVKALEGA